MIHACIYFYPTPPFFHMAVAQWPARTLSGPYFEVSVGTERMAQWWSSCLHCPGRWVQCPRPHRVTSESAQLEAASCWPMSLSFVGGLFLPLSPGYWMSQGGQLQVKSARISSVKLSGRKGKDPKSSRQCCSLVKCA